MGNCFQRGQERQEEEAIQQQQEETGKGFVKESDFGKAGSGIKVKIVLTKEELEWLMGQLNDNEGKRLEDVLAEIGRERERVAAWKPCLETIMECPEMLEMDR